MRFHLLLLLLLIFSCHSGKLSNKKICILVEKMHNELELHYPRIRLQEEGANVVLVGPKENVDYKGEHGMTVKADTTISKISSNQCDALVIPGGFQPDYLRRDHRFVDLVRRMHSDKKLIAAICHGPWLLCSADIIRGVKITSFNSIKDDVKNAGGRWEDREVVVDRNIITSRNPNDLPAFCKAIIKHLS